MRTRLLIAGLAVLSVGFTASLSAEENPRTVKDLLATCAQGTVRTSDAYVYCENAIAWGFMSKDVCNPPKNTPEAAHFAVIKWLTDHPELSNTDELVGAETALKALYPCP